jgi:hypothetical protein
MLRSADSPPSADRPETNSDPQISPTAAKLLKTLFPNMVLPFVSQSSRLV